MALPGTLDWEVRTDGNASNGGAYVRNGLGTDYSQQAAAEAIYTDLVIGNPTTTELSSALRPFVSADRDNVINITGGTGFTTGRYRIVSVSGGVATVDRSVGVAGSTGGAGRLGGALVTLAGALAAMVGSNWIYVRGTGHTAAAAITGGSSGTGDAPSQIIGYGTTRGDNVKAVIQASGSFTSLLNMSGNHWVVRNLELDCNDTVQRALFPAATGIDIYVANCRFRRWTRCGFRSNTTNTFKVVDCLADGGTGGSNFGSEPCAGFVGSGWGTFHRCVAKSCQSNGFCADNGAPMLMYCVAFSMTQDAGVGGHGVYVFGSTGVRAVNCTFASLQGSGIANPNVSATAFADVLVENCMFADIDRYAVESTTVVFGANSDLDQSIRNNAFYDVTLGKQFQVPAGQNEVTLTVNPFVNLVGGDLRLNNTANGGALARAAGVPGALQGEFGTGFTDIGALQASAASFDATDGGAATMFDLWREFTGEFSTTRVSDTVVGRYLNRGLEEFNRLTGYNFADATITLVAEQQEYDLPSDFVKVVWVEHNGKPLDKADLDELRNDGITWRRMKASTPTEYFLYGNKLVLLPKPDAAAVAASSTITLRYVRSPRDIAVFGPEQLAREDYVTAVAWAVYLWCAAHPDSATAIHRMSSFKDVFDRGVQMGAEYYAERALQKAPPPETKRR